MRDKKYQKISFHEVAYFVALKNQLQLCYTEIRMGYFIMPLKYSIYSLIDRKIIQTWLIIGEKKH